MADLEEGYDSNSDIIEGEQLFRVLTLFLCHICKEGFDNSERFMNHLDLHVSAQLLTLAPPPEPPLTLQLTLATGVFAALNQNNPPAPSRINNSQTDDETNMPSDLILTLAPPGKSN